MLLTGAELGLGPSWLALVTAASVPAVAIAQSKVLGFCPSSISWDLEASALHRPCHAPAASLLRGVLCGSPSVGKWWSGPQNVGQCAELSKPWPRGQTASPASLERQPSSSSSECGKVGKGRAVGWKHRDLPAFLSLSLPFNEMGRLGNTFPLPF